MPETNAAANAFANRQLAHGWQLQGTYFDGKTSRAQSVTLRHNGAGQLQFRDDSGNQYQFSLEDITLDPPLGKTARRLHLPDGSLIESIDHAAMQALDALYSQRHGHRLARLEASWPMALLALLLLLVVSAALYFVGIPAAARSIAFATPARTYETMSRETLKTLQKWMDLQDSQLPASRKLAIEEGFHRVVQGMGSTNHTYKLLFFAAPKVGANAFALPAGTIVITDELIQLAESEQEILSVLAHEIHHVEQRHGMRTVLQNTGIFFLVAALFGDIASLSSLGAALPTLLAESNYSRRFESEADTAAANYAIQQGWGTKPLQNILRKVDAQHKRLQDHPTHSTSDSSLGTDMLSSHPDTQKRIEALRAMSPEK